MTRSVERRTAILVFARAPVAGEAKTRLIPALRPAGAARLHRRLTEHALATATGAKAGGVELWCTPGPDHPFFAACVRRYPVALRAQRGTTLGERLAFAAVGAFHESDAVILIGTDCPVLTQVHLQSAAAALADYDAVIHPAEDGGYALLGLARPCPEAFVEIDWGSDRVFHQTMGRLASARMRVSVKETLWDVDTPTDLERLVRAMPEWADTTAE